MKIEFSKSDAKKLEQIVYLFVFGASVLAIPLISFGLYEFMDDKELISLMEQNNKIMSMAGLLLLSLAFIDGVFMFVVIMTGSKIIQISSDSNE